MKLLRCKSNIDGFCEFNNSIFGDVLISENSKIALKNISWVKEQFSLEIDSGNNEIQLDFKDPIDDSVLSTTAFLTVGEVYSSLNFKAFLHDFTEALNKSLKISIPKNIGLSFSAEQDHKTGKLLISSYQNNKFDFFVDEGDTTTDARNINCEIQTGANIYGRKNNGNGYNAALFTINNFYFFKTGRGCGVFSFQVHSFDENDPGLVIGLSSIEPNNLGGNFSPTVHKYDFAIIFRGNGDPYEIIQRDSITGINTKTTTAINGNIVGDGDINNDVMEISMSEGKIQGRVYSQAVPGGTLLFSQEYQPDLDSQYPVVAIHHHGTKISQLRYTPKPRIENQLELQTNLLAVRPPSQSRTHTILTITFQNENIIKFLGFNDLSKTSKSLVEPEIEADFIPKFYDTTEAYILILDSLPISSYDYSDEMKKNRNILSVIQNQKNSNDIDVSFIEPNPIFIDIKNNQPINLKNIKLRVLTNENQRVRILGNAEMCLLIDES